MQCSLKGIFNVAQGRTLGILSSPKMFPEGELQNTHETIEVPFQGTKFFGVVTHRAAVGYVE